MTTMWEGRVAVVTGAGSGIGRATAEQLLEAGASVVGVDLGDEGLSWLEGRERAAAVPGDVSTQACKTDDHLDWKILEKAAPATSDTKVVMKLGAVRMMILFLATITTAVCFHNFLHLPPAAGMMLGLGYLGNADGRFRRALSPAAVGVCRGSTGILPGRKVDGLQLRRVGEVGGLRHPVPGSRRQVAGVD
ncbi:MAG: SDR family NAD(P)-dependent oxidoreductase [Acidobacteria bacterium]|nr:SDR family NAD(P)-dependent oxidoreductase [Candidatus Sulfomarinibacter kjeldsenii]